MRARFTSRGRLAALLGLASMLASASVLAAGDARAAADTADAAAPCPTPASAGVAITAADGTTLTLADGSSLRLAGIGAPTPPPGIAEADWPPAVAARKRLQALAAGRPLRFAAALPAPDRYGRIVAVAVVDQGAAPPVPLAEALLGAGLARVMPGPEPVACLAPLLPAEREAREKRLGLWADPYYAIRAARDRTLADRTDAYDLVEGRVVSVGIRGPTAYLDFGRNWRTDFTAVVPGATGEALARLGLAPATLAGRRVRLRGWIEQRDGPSVRVIHPGQLELLDDGD